MLPSAAKKPKTEKKKTKYDEALELLGDFSDTEIEVLDQSESVCYEELEQYLQAGEASLNTNPLEW